MVPKRHTWLVFRRSTTGDAFHRRIEAETAGMAHVIVFGQASKHRLAEEARKQVAYVFASMQIGQRRSLKIGQTKNLVRIATFDMQGAELQR